MEVDTKPVKVDILESRPDGGLDSDDETLKFDEDDDLYDVAADEEDAKWAARQHRPAAEFEGEEDESPASGTRNTGGGDDEEDDYEGDYPPTISDSADAGDLGGNRPPEHQKQQQRGESSSNARKREGVRGRGVTGIASDAHLSCPLCFATVCLECQRHAKYSNQFRAVTGINVNVKYDVFLTLDQVSGGGGGRKKDKRGSKVAPGSSTGPPARKGVTNSTRSGTPPPADVGGEGGQGEEEMFHPVCCGECDHLVGVFDAEEVFHFFGVVASG